jgi:hypothetical protein
LILVFFIPTTGEMSDYAQNFRFAGMLVAGQQSAATR